MTGAATDLPGRIRAIWHAITWADVDYTAVTLDDEILAGWVPVRVHWIEDEEEDEDMTDEKIPWYTRAFRWIRRRPWWLLGLPVVLGGLWRAIKWLWGPDPEPLRPRVDDERRVEAEKERIKAHAEAERERVNERADNLLDAIREKLGDE